jgi:hypothetical protein
MANTSALFLLSLDHATQWRETHPWVIWLLPVAGFAVGLAYHLIGGITQKQSLPKELQDQQAQAISLYRAVSRVVQVVEI